MGRKSGGWTRPEQKWRRFPEGSYPVDHCLALRQDWRKGCRVFCPSRSVAWTVNKGHHLGSCLQSHHIGLLELLTPRCLAAFSPALQKDTHPITGDSWTLRALGNHSQCLSSILRPQTVTASLCSTIPKRTLSLRPNPSEPPWDLCFLRENLTGPERGTSGSTIGAEAIACHREQQKQNKRKNHEDLKFATLSYRLYLPLNFHFDLSDLDRLAPTRYSV